MATAVAGMIATSVVFVAKWVWMGAQALIQGARMAAAWLLAMGPVGWVIAAVVGLAAIVIANWDKISNWTQKTWSKVSQWISTKWEEAKSATGTKIASMVATTSAKFAEIVSKVKAKMTEAKTALSNKWEEAKSATSAKLSNLVSTVLTFFTQVVSKVREKMSEAVRTLGQKVGEMPGKVLSFVGQMLSAGADLVRGLIEGIKSMATSAINAITGVVDGVIGKAKSLLKIKSPSRVFMQIGDFVGQGLANGVTGTAKQVAAAGAKLASKLTQALNDKATTKTQKVALQSVKTYAAKQINILQGIAKQRESMATKIKAATAKLDEAIKLRNDFAASVKDSAIKFGSITNSDAKTGDGIAKQMADRLKAIRDFKKNIDKLVKSGLNKTTLEEIVSAGVENGGAMASTLASSSTGVIADINKTQKEIVSVSSKLGKEAANQFYGLGVDSARGIVKGLESQAKALEKSADAISDILVKAVKKRLKIKSPSRVFAEMGGFASEGMAVGLANKAKLAVREVTNVTSAMTSAFNPEMELANMSASAQLNTSVSRADMGVVRHSFAAEIEGFEKDEPDLYLVVDGKELGKVVAKPVKEENDRQENIVKIGRGRR